MIDRSPWWNKLALRARLDGGNLRARLLARGQRLATGHKRIYFFHIRKTAGTSFNSMFLGLGGEEPGRVLQRLSASPFRRAFSGGKVYVGWNRALIRRGDYFYAFSHIPAHQLTLPHATFTITGLRDPVDRVISHYRMLLGYQRQRPSHPDLASEGSWLGNGFSDFLKAIPREHLLRQLYMFSESFDVEEAARAIAECDHVFFRETYDAGIESLAAKLGMLLTPLRLHESPAGDRVSSAQRIELRGALEPEYRLLARVRQVLSEGSNDPHHSRGETRSDALA